MSTTDSTDALLREAMIEAMLDKFQLIAGQISRASELAQEAAEMKSGAEADFEKLRGAAELWQIDLFEELQKRKGNPNPAPSALFEERPTVRNFILSEAASALPAPVRAAELRALYQERYGQHVHEKTFGMTLYRLSKEGHMRRDGHADWLYVPFSERQSAYYPPRGVEDDEVEHAIA